MPVRRVTFRVYPNRKQEKILRYHRKLHKDLYNCAVSNRFTQYQKFGHKVDYFEQQNSLPAFKEVWTEYKECNCMTLQGTLKRVDFAFQRWLKGLGKRPKYKSIRHYSGWTYPSKTGWKAHTTGDNGYLDLANIGSIQMRGKARIWGKPTTCTIVYRNGKWYASITVEVEETKRATDIGAVGIDFGCKSALAITDGENHSFVEAPKFLRQAEAKIKKLSQSKRRKTASNRSKKQKASRRWKKTQAKISKVTRKVANQRANWVHQVAADIVSSNSFVATEKLEVVKMTARAKKGKRKKQKVGLNKSILDLGFGMLRSAIQYKVTEAGGVFVEVPTRTVKPSQTCPNCGSQRKKSLDERVHQCKVCGFTMDRDLAAALVMLLWSLSKLPGFETNLVDADVTSSTSDTSKRKFAGSQKQLGQMKRQKSKSTGLDAKTQTSTQ